MAAALLLPLAFFCLARGQDDFPVQNFNILIDSPQISEASEPWVLPLSKPLGEVSGLALDNKGHLVAFHRADRIWNEFSFDKNEKLNSSYGAIPNATIAVINPDNGEVSQLSIEAAHQLTFQYTVV